ncbi:MAG: hypothetical protein RR321_04835 [Acidaminococcaceae bacterium]
MRRYFELKIYPTTKLCLGLLVVLAGLWYRLQPYAARENGPIEDLQVLFLLLGLVVAIHTFVWAISLQERRIWQGGSVILLFLIGRELGWGGEIYAFDDWWYRAVIYPVLAVLATGTLVVFWRNKLGNFLVKKRIPLWELGLFIFFYGLADVAEHQRLDLWLTIPKGLLVEELAELGCYCFLVSATMIAASKTVLFSWAARRQVWRRTYLEPLVLLRGLRLH